MKTIVIALIVSLAASAGACWFYLDVVEGQMRASIDETVETRPEHPELAEAFGNLDEVVDEYLPDAVAEARAWTWRHVYPRLVVFTFLCAVATSLLAKRRADEAVHR